ncbi:amidohydrolase family protein [Chloroflexota bacterium]
MKRIAIEEHFYTEGYVEYLKSTKDLPRLEITKDEKGNQVVKRGDITMDPDQFSKLVDMGEGRLRQMDEDGIDMQVLSLLNPGVAVFDASTGKTLARKTNDELASVVRKYPERFAGFAALPVQEPIAATNELERAVKELGLKGAMINSHVKGEFLDDHKYWVIFAKAEELGVPIYIHPIGPPPDMIKPYLAYPRLSGPMFGYAHEVGLHAVRLIFSGLFDKHPDLKIILGHLGEGLPFWLWRLDNRWQKEVVAPAPMANRKIRKTPSQYIRDNFYVTTSGMFWQPALSCAYEALGADRILFAADYPPESSKEAAEFIDAAPICEADKEKIYHINAERLLAL